MPYLGTIVNVATIIAGSLVGLVLRRGLSKRIMDTIMHGVSLAVILIGISGAIKSAFSIADDTISTNYIMLTIVALAVGALIGELIQIERGIESFGRFFEKKLSQTGEPSTFAQGFVTATIVFCVGSMAIVGALEDGINSNSEILFAKSMLDGITSMIFASTMGLGVLFSAIAVGVYQGMITLLSIFIAPYLTGVVITQISLVGSVLIMAIGFNMLSVTKIKVGNLLPAIFIPVVYNVILQLFTG